MKPLAEAGPNTEQIRDWNDQAGAKWVDHAERLDAHIGPLGRLALERAELAAGQRVLDVGCGCGQTSLELARRVGPAGRVTGIDLSAPMLARAAERAREAGLSNLSFEAADAQTAALGAGRFDRIFSRFGVMFFADPVAGFGNLRGALADAGLLTFVCWQELGRNPWALEPLLAAGKHIPLPEPPAAGAPGPFALADPERLRGLLRDAGFERVEIEGVETEIQVGGARGVDEATDFLLEIGPTSRALAEAEPDARAAVAGAVREVMAAHWTPQGVRMGCAVWVVVAR
jgi:SAM-dependent methyltransferase